MNKFNKIFKNKSPIIGAIHFSPLPGFEGFISLESVLENALKDLEALEKGGVDGIIVENNYDIPHQIYVGAETVAAMTYLTLKIMKKTTLPVGVSVLWNDYRAAFSVAKVTGAKFIRIPAFVDSVRTDYGDVTAVAEEAIEFRRKIKANNIAIFADVQVKHSEIIDKTKTLTQSIDEALKYEIEGIIVTGKWTGDAPNIDDLVEAQKAANGCPIIIGSGVNVENILLLKKYVTAFIVGTSLKEGLEFNKEKEVNIKSYNQRVSLGKVKELVLKNKS